MKVANVGHIVDAVRANLMACPNDSIRLEDIISSDYVKIKSQLGGGYIFSREESPNSKGNGDSTYILNIRRIQNA